MKSIFCISIVPLCLLSACTDNSDKRKSPHVIVIDEIISPFTIIPIYNNGELMAIIDSIENKGHHSYLYWAETEGRILNEGSLGILGNIDSVSKRMALRLINGNGKEYTQGGDTIRAILSDSLFTSLDFSHLNSRELDQSDSLITQLLRKFMEYSDSLKRSNN